MLGRQHAVTSKCGKQCWHAPCCLAVVTSGVCTLQSPRALSPGRQFRSSLAVQPHYLHAHRLPLPACMRASAGRQASNGGLLGGGGAAGLRAPHDHVRAARRAREGGAPGPQVRRRAAHPHGLAAARCRPRVRALPQVHAAWSRPLVVRRFRPSRTLCLFFCVCF